jgi:hypothetical protein
VEGEQTRKPKAADFARDDVVTCGLEDEVGAVGARIQESPYPFGLVVSSTGVILGRLRSSLLDCDPRFRAEQVMEAGPKTFRPHKSAASIARELADRELRWAIITSPEGELIGVATRAELEGASD